MLRVFNSLMLFLFLAWAPLIYAGTAVTWNGSSYTVPSVGETGWFGADKVDGLLIDLATDGFQKTGGNFTITGEVDFGGTTGLTGLYWGSRTASSSATGIFRLANTEGVGWRNAADSADLLLAVDALDNLTFNGSTFLTAQTLVPVTAGGTGLTSYTAGDLIYASAAETIAPLNIGSANEVLKTDGSTPSWGSIVNANVDGSAAVAYSKLNLSDSIVNADVNTAAAIAYSKLNLTGTLLNADVNSSAAIVYSKLDLSGSIVNADVASNAAIAVTKLGAITTGSVMTTTASGLITTESQLAIARGGSASSTIGAAFDTFAQTTTKGDLVVRDASSADRLAIGTNNQVLTADSTQTLGVKWADSSGATNAGADAFLLENIGITTSVGSNALTIELRSNDGSTELSASEIGKVAFRVFTITEGAYSILEIDGPITDLVISSTATMGHISSKAEDVYVYLINNGGAAVLGASTKLFDDGDLLTSTAEGDDGSADGRFTLYTESAVTAKPGRLIGKFISNQPTAGTWSSTMDDGVVNFNKSQVMTGFGGRFRMESAQGSCTGSSTITNGTGTYNTTFNPWITSIGNISNGECAIVFADDWAATPTCTANVIQHVDTLVTLDNLATTGTDIGGFTAGVNATSIAFTMTCIGIK